jgi:hypothetical protein
MLIEGFDRPTSDLRGTAETVNALAEARSAALFDVLEEVAGGERGTAMLRQVLSGGLHSYSTSEVGLHVGLGNLHASLASGCEINRACTILARMLRDRTSTGSFKHPRNIEVWSSEALSVFDNIRLDRRVIDPRRNPELLDETFDFLGEIWPECVPWLQLVVKHLAIVEGDDANLVSGSLDHVLGFFYISLNVHALRTAEMLVHEGSHQFFLLAEQAFPVVYEDDKLYYSPFARRPRPLSKVMLGFHAFSNICELYRRASELSPANVPEWWKEFDTPYDLSGIRRLFCEQMPNITPAGRALIESML